MVLEPVFGPRFFHHRQDESPLSRTGPGMFEKSGFFLPGDAYSIGLAENWQALSGILTCDE
jgi:hypothetical protein